MSSLRTLDGRPTQIAFVAVRGTVFVVNGFFDLFVHFGREAEVVLGRVRKLGPGFGTQRKLGWLVGYGCDPNLIFSWLASLG